MQANSTESQEALRAKAVAAQLAAPSQSAPSHPSQPQTGCQHHATLSRRPVTTPAAARRRAGLCLKGSKGERQAEAGRKVCLCFGLITHAN